MRSQIGVQLWTENLIGAEQTLNTHGGNFVGVVSQALKVVNGKQQHAEHSIGAIDEGKALFFAKLNWGDAGLGQKLWHRALHAVLIEGLPSPIKTMAQCANGARSPLQPSEPNS
jgi:hypothetical protein